MSVVRHQDRRRLGLVIALIVSIAQPVQRLRYIAHALDHVLGPSLLPAVVVRPVALILHWQARSYEAKSSGQNAKPRAQQSRATMGQIERLATYGQLRERAPDIETIRDFAAEAALDRVKHQGANRSRPIGEPIVA
jgi:hypothetical protein